jgi:hypothetical protein
MKGLLRESLIGWPARAGFGLGVLGGAAYLLFDGEYLFQVPRWAQVVFYPGFATGFQAYHWGLREAAAKIVGVAAVGLTYALIAAIVRFVWLAVRPANGPTNSTSQVQR